MIKCVKVGMSRWRHFPIGSHPLARSRRLWCTRGPRRRWYQRLPPGRSFWGIRSPCSTFLMNHQKAHAKPSAKYQQRQVD